MSLTPFSPFSLDLAALAPGVHRAEHAAALAERAELHAAIWGTGVRVHFPADERGILRQTRRGRCGTLAQTHYAAPSCPDSHVSTSPM
jgi:hypothetical protein